MWHNSKMLKDKSSLPEIESEVLKFWEEAHIFEKTITQRKATKPFSFYDGPPFATGLPHYGHILATAIKDSVTRFWTMKGYRVERRVGWDCHGLPVENLVEKELGLKDKKAVLDFGIEKFNDACRSAVFRSVNDFEKTLKRVGRFADYSDSYATLDNSYIASVWWVFKSLWERGLVYSDYRVSPYCTRCGTPLSNFEVNQGYKNTTDPAIFVKFKLKESDDKIPTYFIAWTTTPWTLTANAILVAHKDIEYVQVIKDSINGKERFICAKNRLEALGFSNLKIEKHIKGEELKGKEYIPPYNFIIPDKKAHFVVLADFVSADDGSGIVHAAPAFGADDMEVAKKHGVPMILTVDKEGKFIKEVTPFAGQFVKKADPEIIKDLEERGLLLKQETVDHEYPFCWRCDSPLLYYPIDSWYIAVSKIKDVLVKNNKKIRWVPSHIKTGRFGKWIEDAKDWAVSRDRFWGAPIPVWKCESCSTYMPVGSLKELGKLAPLNNEYILMRHGESDSNVLSIVSSSPEKTSIKLTKKGKEEVLKSAKELKKKKIDLIISSPLQRTIETAEIVADYCGASYETDERLREYDFGTMNGRPLEEFLNFAGSVENRFVMSPEEGETMADIKKRVLNFIADIEKKYKGKKILIVSHADPLFMIQGVLTGMDKKDLIAKRNSDFMRTAEIRAFKVGKIPLNKDGEPDLHKPYIDEIEIDCTKCGGKAKREQQVFDCWFESGAMPFASWNYPFSNKKKVENIFPADFIAEGLDQTRGWFYTLHVLASALTIKKSDLGKDKPAFKNVIVNGLILDELGRKLSKKLRNYTEPEILFDKTGADAVRYFLLSSTSIGEDYRFSDKGVIEAKTKISERLLNSYNFFAMYADKKQRVSGYKSKAKETILDSWIKARFKQAIEEVNQNMEQYELTKATRPIADLLDDLSNWYIRRSRERLQRPSSKEDFYAASKTLYDCLIMASKIMAPFTPFIAEAVYKSLTKNKESVHLENWPSAEKITKKEKDLIEKMIIARIVSSQALAKRAEAGIKVKQPLASYKITIPELKQEKEICELIASEANVKQVLYDDKAGESGVLDTEITGELKEEGLARELVRIIQDMRAKANLKPKEPADFYIYTENKEIQNIILKNENKFKKDLSLKHISQKKSDDMIVSAETKLGEGDIWVGIR